MIGRVVWSFSQQAQSTSADGGDPAGDGNGDPCWGAIWYEAANESTRSIPVRPDREAGSGPIVAAIRRVTGFGDGVIHAISPPVEPLHQNALPASFGFSCILLRRNPLNRYAATPACDSLSIKNMTVSHGQK